MALTGPSVVINAGSHSANKFRQFLMTALPRVGVAGTGDCLVKQRASPGQGVLVSAGGIYCLGTSSSIQGVYFDFNDADLDVPASAADGSQTRIDRVIFRVRDVDYVVGTPPNAFEWLTGVAGSGLPPVVPVDSISLAQVARAINGNTLTNGMFTDERVYASTLGGAVRGWKVPGAPTTGTYPAGAFGFDSNGALWACVVAGTPGTWYPTDSVRFATVTPSGVSTFTQSIPAGFKSVTVRWRARDTSANAFGTFGLVGIAADGTATYNYAGTLAAMGSALALEAANNVTAWPFFVTAGGGQNASVWAHGELRIPRASDATFPHVIAEMVSNNTSGTITRHTAGDWENGVGPIPSLKFTCQASNYAAGSTFDFIGHA